jgi:hypothetical protein
MASIPFCDAINTQSIPPQITGAQCSGSLESIPHFPNFRQKGNTSITIRPSWAEVVKIGADRRCVVNDGQFGKSVAVRSCFKHIHTLERYNFRVPERPLVTKVQGHRGVCSCRAKDVQQGRFGTVGIREKVGVKRRNRHRAVQGRHHHCISIKKCQNFVKAAFIEGIQISDANGWVQGFYLLMIE